MFIDPLAETFGLHSSLFIPIGAKSKIAIERYVGSITDQVDGGKAFIVSFEPLSLPNDLPVWKHSRSSFLTQQKQVWVDVDYKYYRKLYLATCEKDCIKDSDVIDHIMNRKLARALGYRYVRLLHVDRETNSSSGRGGETIAVGNLEIGMRINPDINAAEIVYADPSDLLKMLNTRVGGFGLDVVRDHHHLFYDKS